MNRSMLCRHDEMMISTRRDIDTDAPRNRCHRAFSPTCGATPAGATKAGRKRLARYRTSRGEVWLLRSRSPGCTEAPTDPVGGLAPAGLCVLV